MKLLNHLLIFAASLVPMLALTSCEEEESPIRFTAVANSHPESFTYKYFSPDPRIFEKLHYIDADINEGDIVLQCTTHRKIAITNMLASPSDLETNTYRSENGAWTSSISDGNILKIHFDKLDADKDYDERYIIESLGIAALTKKGLLVVYIDITRELPYKAKE